MKKLKDLAVKNKRALVRCDFNLPLSDDNKILDDFRMVKALPTIQYLIKEKAKVILMSHLETRDKKVSLQYILPRLEELLKLRVGFIDDYPSKGALETTRKMEPGQVILLENLRFHDGEKANEAVFAREISKMGDVYVNEAFSACHRAHASIVGVANNFPCMKAPGFLLEKEIEIFTSLLEKPEHPFVAVIGGIKIETKIKTILNILKIADHVLLGSKLGEILFAEKKIIIGRDVSGIKMLDEIDIMDPKLHLPVDGVIALKDPKEKYYREAGLGTLRKEEAVYDIGPYTRRIFKRIIESAKTILWNGSLGMHEDERFEKGTRDIAEAITRNHSAFKVAGGGETVSAIDQFGMTGRFDFLSTGGGAMLEFLAGDKLPGIAALNSDD